MTEVHYNNGTRLTDDMLHSAVKSEDPVATLSIRSSIKSGFAN